MVRPRPRTVSPVAEIKTMGFDGYRSKLCLAAAFCLLIISVLAIFSAQNTQPSPTPQPSPTASVTPPPTRAPSPTPLPEVQNFHQWGAITLFNGLPSDSVRAIEQTPDGVMWFGTDNGLARFDGRRVQNYSLGGDDADRVLALRTFSNGELWVGTRSGAFIYSEGRFQRIEGTQNYGITAILNDTDIFLATDAGIVLRAVPAEGGTFTSTSVFPEPIQTDDGGTVGITSLARIGGRIVAGTSGRGIFNVDETGPSEFATIPRQLFVNALTRGTDGTLWLGADAARGSTGIYFVEDGRKAQRVAAPTADVLALEANESGLWAGTERFGLFHVDGSKLKKHYTFENTSGGLRSDTIYALFTDREGVIWIGTNRGVSRFDRLGPFQRTVSDSPNSNFIRTLLSSRNGLFAGSNRGLFELDGDQWKPVGGFKDKIIYAIGETDGGMIVGTSTGTFDARGRPIASGDTRGLGTFNGRTYAAVLGRGLVDISGPKQEVVFADGTTSSLLIGRDRLWIGSMEHGLFSFDGKTIKTEIPPEVLKSGAIWNIAQDTASNIWIAGQHGVFRILNGQVELVIAADDVRDVFVDGPDVWAATTTRGLLHARYDKRFGWLNSSIGFEQGLPSEKAFSIIPVDGLLIATNRGVVTYRPGRIVPKIIATRVLSQRLHAASELGSTIELSYPQNSLLVEVAGQSSRTFPEEFQYAFTLKNEHGEVIESRISAEPQYSPANLGSGNYKIEAEAFDRDLLSSDPLTISFSVARAPFPWTATALGILLAVAVIALIWAIMERRQIVVRNRQLAAARLDLANEAERERRRIARDLHDQTLADLRDLMMKSDRTSLTGTGFRGDIESISTEIRRICEDLSPSVLENVGLLASLEFLLGRTVDAYRFDAEETLEEELKFRLNVQLQIYRICQEALTNIKRHAMAKLVKMRVSAPSHGSFRVEIVNDGIPFVPDDSALNRGRGIAGIRTRASLINADTKWDLDSDGQPRFRLTIRK